MSDLGELIDICDPEGFTVIREDAGQYIDGVHQSPDSQEFDGSGVFHNADAKTLSRLDENTRTREVLVGYTSCELRIANIPKKHLADRICLRDSNYEIHEVSPWPQGGFFQLLCVRLGQ